MRYRVRHLTRYTGAEPISVAHNEAWLTPRASFRQRLVAHRLEVSPEPSVRSSRVDYFGNQVTHFSFNQGYESLEVTAVNEVEIWPRGDDAVEPAAPGAGAPEPPWEAVAQALARRTSDEEFAAAEFVYVSPRCRPSRTLADYCRASFTDGRPLRAALLDLLARFHAEFRYDQAATTVTTPVEQVFRHRRGVCQDFAHLLISMLRSLGLAARYVSGYLRTTPPPGTPRLVGADASHAWVSVFGGPLGWIDVDPTNNSLPSLDHVTLAWGRDYTDVAPLKGVCIGGGQLQLHVSVDVAEVEVEDPPPSAFMDVHPKD